jgi:hypothetical protein
MGTVLTLHFEAQEPSLCYTKEGIWCYEKEEYKCFKIDEIN